VSGWGYGVVVTFVLGPAAVWAMIGCRQVSTVTVSRFVLTAVLLAVGTGLFYLCFYAFIWQ
jgi:hypothetical protein